MSQQNMEALNSQNFSNGDLHLEFHILFTTDAEYSWVGCGLWNLPSGGQCLATVTA